MFSEYYIFILRILGIGEDSLKGPYFKKFNEGKLLDLKLTRNNSYIGLA